MYICVFMGLRVNKLTLAGLLNIKRLKSEQPQTRDVATSVREASLPEFGNHNRNSISALNRDLSPLLSQTLSLSRNNLLPEAPRDSLNFQIKESEAIQKRARSTVGLGNRQIVETHVKGQRLDRIFPDAPDNYGDSVSANIQLDFSQNDLQNLRDAIGTYANEVVSATPQISGFDLRDEVDAKFGEGVSELFKIRITDDNGGESSIRISQVEESPLTAEEKGVVATALNQASAVYEFKDSAYALSGEDIDLLTNELQSSVPLAQQSLVLDLKAELKQTGDVAGALENFRSAIEDSGLSRRSESKVNRALNELSLRNTTVLSGFNQNAIADDLQIIYKSGRYKNAFDSETIDQVSNYRGEADDEDF